MIAWLVLATLLSGSGTVSWLAYLRHQRRLIELEHRREDLRRQAESADRMISADLNSTKQNSEALIIKARTDEYRARYHVEQCILAQKVAESLSGYNAEKVFAGVEGITRDRLLGALTRQLDGDPPGGVRVADVPSWTGSSYAEKYEVETRVTG